MADPSGWFVFQRGSTRIKCGSERINMNIIRLDSYSSALIRVKRKASGRSDFGFRGSEAGEEAVDAGEDFAEGVGVGEEGDAKVVAPGHVEARARDHQHAFLLQQAQGKGVVVEAAGGVADHRREAVERTLRCDQ